jgi:subtilisin family serine protease
MNDTMLVNSNVVPVHNGQAPLVQGYDGSGVVIGIIDTGIDFNHPDLQDSLGNSRVKYLWDQAQPADVNTPVYGYGQEWNNLEIDAGLAAAHNDIAWNGHGTHVSGIAAGNGLASGDHKGVAPKADIIFVAFDFYSPNPSLMTDAVDYIYSKANAMAKPCVINASLGDYYGSHDGLDLQAQMIKNMINAQPGRAFVAASGNAGNIPFHLGYTVTSDTNFTFLYSGTTLSFQLWADTADLKNVDFSIGADQMTPTYSFRGNIPFSDISTHLGVLKSDTLFNGGNRIGIIQSYGDLNGGVYSMDFYITPDSATYNWRLMTTGSGKFDLWSFSLINSGIPSATVMPDSVFYKYPDLNQTMVSSFQCLDNVITVGNYINRRSIINYDTLLYVDLSKIPGALHATSSAGPTRDGRIKPDIAAPGDMTMSCSLLANLPADAIAYPDYYDPGGYHTRGGGTSAASPGVAGIAALYLQQNPAATSMDIKNAIIGCPTIDAFTGTSLPDNQWGYGKANAFGALTACGFIGISEQKITPDFSTYPNPVSYGSVVTVNIPEFNAGRSNELKIYNSVGQLVKSVSIKSNSVQFNANLMPGIYFCNFLSDGKKTNSKKLVIIK